MEAPPYTPVLIAGFPRTGTTLLSALVSTSSSCNAQAPEFHYLGFLSYALKQTLALYDDSQGLFFTSRDALIRNFSMYIRTVLDDAWNALGRPPYLVLKHNRLSALFGVLSTHLPNARFLLSIRDPRDTIASMIRTKDRIRQRHGPPDPLEVSLWISQFNEHYAPVIANAKTTLTDRMLVVHNEMLLAGHFDSLRHFLALPDIDPDVLWKRTLFRIEDYKSDRMYSNHWCKPITTAVANSYQAILPPEQAEMVSRQTKHTMESLFAISGFKMA